MSKAVGDDIVRFVQTHIGSVWGLRLMSVMINEPERGWTASLLVKELRANDLLIGDLLDRFLRLGLTIAEADGVWHWRPATPEMNELSQRVAQAYAEMPFRIIQAIAEAPEDRLRQFADAFRLRRD